MKKNTLRKLTLSALTMGVATLSLSSTTYAWFTANGSATASGISGTVESADSELLIKTATYSPSKTVANQTVVNWPANFSSNINNIENVKTYKNTSNDSEEINNVEVSTSMVPVTWSTITLNDSSETGFHKSTTAGDFSTPANMNVDVLHYEVVFAITNLQRKKDKNVKVKFSEFESSNVSQYLLVSDGVNAAGSTITTNILDALSVRIESRVLSDYSSYNINDDKPEDIPLVSARPKTLHYKEDESQTCNSITYYNNVYGLTDNKITYPQSSGYQTATLENSSYTPISLFTVLNNACFDPITAYVKTDFYFYIEGFDYQCFNCLGGSSFDAGKMTFSLD